MNISKFQIGKNGITPGVIESLTLLFKNHKQVRISMLKTSGRDRNTMESMAKDISTQLESKDKKNSFNFKVIGFTIVMIKSQKR